MRTLIALLAFALAACAQNQHAVTLTWEDGQNPAGTTYNAYRASGACSPAATFGAPLNATPISGLTYTDATVTTGRYCYIVRAVANGIESADSNQAEALVKPFSVTITVTVGK